MPAFMAISGYLYFRPQSTVNSQQSTVNSQQSRNLYFSIRKRTKQLFIPFLSWSLVYLFLKNSYSFESVFRIFLKPDGGFWFLWVLFVIFVLFCVTIELSKKVKFNSDISLLFVCLLLVSFMVLFEFRLFGYQFIAYYFLFFVFGYFFHKFYSFIPKWMLSEGIIFIVFMLWFITASWWRMKTLPPFLEGIPIIPSALLQYAYRFFVAFCGIYVLLNFAPRFFDSETVINKILGRFGTMSLGIYPVHLLLIYLGGIKGLKNIFPAFNNLEIVFISFLMFSCFSYGIIWVLGRNRITSRLFLGK